MLRKKNPIVRFFLKPFAGKCWFLIGLWVTLSRFFYFYVIILQVKSLLQDVPDWHGSCWGGTVVSHSTYSFSLKGWSLVSVVCWSLQFCKICFHHVCLCSRTILHEHVTAKRTKINIFFSIGMDFLLCRSMYWWTRLLVFQTRDLMLGLVYDGRQHLFLLNENVTIVWILVIILWLWLYMCCYTAWCLKKGNLIQFGSVLYGKNDIIATQCKLDVFVLRMELLQFSSQHKEAIWMSFDCCFHQEQRLTSHGR